MAAFKHCGLGTIEQKKLVKFASPTMWAASRKRRSFYCGACSSSSPYRREGNGNKHSCS